MHPLVGFHESFLDVFGFLTRLLSPLVGEISELGPEVPDSGAGSGVDNTTDLPVMMKMLSKRPQQMSILLKQYFSMD